MKRIPNGKERKFYKMIINFSQHGGDIKNFKKMMDFCLKYDIDIEKLGIALKDDSILDRLKQVGLL